MTSAKHRLGYRCLISLFLISLLLSLWTPIAKAAEKDAIDIGVMEITGVLKGGTFTLTPEIAENIFDLEGSVFP